MWTEALQAQIALKACLKARNLQVDIKFIYMSSALTEKTRAAAGSFQQEAYTREEHQCLEILYKA